MAETRTHKDLWRTLSIAGILALLGLAGNACNLSVTYSVSFIFGSVFSTIAVGLLGLWWGAGVALVAASYSYHLWGHPYAILIFTAEAVWIGVALKRGRRNILLIDALYWLCLGIPLVLLCYAGIMGMAWQGTAIIALKQTMNGLFNVQIAGMVLFLSPLAVWLGIQPHRPRCTYADLLFLLVSIFVITSTIGILLLESRRQLTAAQEKIVASVHAEARETEDVVASWVARLVNATRIISELAVTGPLHPSTGLQEELAQIHALFPDFHNVLLGDAQATTVGFHPAVNEFGNSTIGLSYADRPWFKELQRTRQPVISEVFQGRGGTFEPIFCVSVPVIGDGKVAAFGLGSVNLKRMEGLFERYGERGDLTHTVIDQNGVVVVSTSPGRRPLDPMPTQVAGQSTPIAADVSLFTPGNKKNVSIMESWKDAYYFTKTPIHGTPWTLQVEFPVAPLQQEFYAEAIWGLSLRAVFFLVMIALAAFISHTITRPILSLALISKNLPEKIEGHEEIPWPQTNSVELAELISNFRETSAALAGRMSEIKEASLRLEETVTRRTADLQEERQRLTDIISARQQMEEQIKCSLREKEVMLKEIHHRVKNNMQVIYSLLNLQAKGIGDQATRAMFEESRNRVSSMALIHEKLYQSADLASINFKEYLQSLMTGIAATYKRPNVTWTVEMEPQTLDINVGIPCGLIVNELVSNSYKYAFPDGRAGTITLGISRERTGMTLLTVADNGVGFPAEIDFHDTTSLGLQIVNVLTGQIHGTIELVRGAGTKFRITFPGTSNG